MAECAWEGDGAAPDELRQPGAILHLDEAFVTVKLDEGACCSGCKVCDSEDRLTKRVPRDLIPGAEGGQRVVIRTRLSGRLKASLLLFLVPTVAFLAGIVLSSVSGLVRSPGLQLLCGLALMVVSYGFAVRMGSRSPSPISIEILREP